jgi:hypothetical protein
VNDDDLERQLRAALRPVNPRADFAAAVEARIAAEGAVRLRPSRLQAVAGWATFGLAASVIAAVLLAHQWQVRRTEQGLEARRQLLEALRVTDEKLELASRVVNTPPHAAASHDSGA